MDVGVLVKGQNGKALPGKIAQKRISEKGRPAFLGELIVWAKQVSELENLNLLEDQIENHFLDFKLLREEMGKLSEATANCLFPKVA